jgi:hypothetical protein
MKLLENESDRRALRRRGGGASLSTVRQGRAFPANKKAATFDALHHGAVFVLGQSAPERPPNGRLANAKVGRRPPGLPRCISLRDHTALPRVEPGQTAETQSRDPSRSLGVSIAGVSANGSRGCNVSAGTPGTPAASRVNEGTALRHWSYRLHCPLIESTNANISRSRGVSMYRGAGLCSATRRSSLRYSLCAATYKFGTPSTRLTFSPSR